MNLFELDSQVRAALDLYEQGFSEIVDTETGEIKPLSEYIEELNLTKEEKITNLCKYIKNTESDVEALDRQKKVFADRLDKTKKKLESAKEYLQTVLDGSKWKDKEGRFEVSYRKSEAVEIKEGADIPPEFLVPQEPKVSKTELKKALKNGAVIEGVSLVERQNMSVK